MSNRTKYYISVVVFTVATIYMLYVQGQMISAGYAGTLGTWDIVQMFISFAVLIAAIIMFIHFRSRKNSSEISEEELLTHATKQPEDTNQSHKKE